VKQVNTALEDPQVELAQSVSVISGMSAGLRMGVTAKKQGSTAGLKSVPKYKNKTYHHFTN
jgi:hypothetical protein